MKCDICEKEIPPVGLWLAGNDADPVVDDGRCCNDCNVSVVIPTRLKLLREKRRGGQ